MVRQSSVRTVTSSEARSSSGKPGLLMSGSSPKLEYHPPSIMSSSSILSACEARREPLSCHGHVF